MPLKLAPARFSPLQKVWIRYFTYNENTVHGHETGGFIKRAAPCRGGGDTEHKIMQMKNMNLMPSEPGKGWKFASYYIFFSSSSHSSPVRKINETQTTTTRVPFVQCGRACVGLMGCRTMFAYTCSIQCSRSLFYFISLLRGGC